MIFSLSEFLNKIGTGARSSNFEIQITTNGTAPSFEENSRILIKNTQFPELVLNKTVINHHGFPTNIFLDRPIADWTATFFCDGEQRLHKQFIEWQRQFRDINPEGNNEANLDLAKTASITITQKDITLKEDIRTMTLLNAVPITISAIELNKESINISEFTVTFAYSGIEDGETK